MELKRKEQPTPFAAVEDEDIMKITPLGAGNEVGRSCILIEFKGKRIMLDCGLHPAHTGLSALPFFDHIDDISTIDLVLITHFHVDHAAALPYFMEKTNFKGRVYMTHPTRAIYKWLLSDYVKIRFAALILAPCRRMINCTTSRISLNHTNVLKW